METDRLPKERQENDRERRNRGLRFSLIELHTTTNRSNRTRRLDGQRIRRVRGVLLIERRDQEIDFGFIEFI